MAFKDKIKGVNNSTDNSKTGIKCRLVNENFNTSKGKEDKFNVSKYSCFKCNEPGHYSRDCPRNYRGSKPNNYYCNHCKRTGHTTDYCRNKPVNNSSFREDKFKRIKNENKNNYFGNFNKPSNNSQGNKQHLNYSNVRRTGATTSGENQARQINSQPKIEPSSVSTKENSLNRQ